MKHVIILTTILVSSAAFAQGPGQLKLDPAAVAVAEASLGTRQGHSQGTHGSITGVDVDSSGHAHVAGSVVFQGTACSLRVAKTTDNGYAVDVHGGLGAQDRINLVSCEVINYGGAGEILYCQSGGTNYSFKFNPSSKRIGAYIAHGEGGWSCYL